MTSVNDTPGLTEERQATLEILRMPHLCVNPDDLTRNLLILARCYSGCEAVAIRLRKGPEFPYAASHGFSPDFLSKENRLCARGAEGQLLRDEKGDPLLECMCGNVLAGRVDPQKGWFTQSSFFTNSTSDLLASIPPEQGRGSSRNHCHTAGYESVALIPIRLNSHVYGLFHCADHRRDRFTPEGIALLEDLADGAAHLFQFAML